MDDLPGVEFPPPPDHWREARPDGAAAWSILSSLEWSVIDKMRARGVPLKDWDVKINRGITTGLNEAFIIDTATRDALIAADPKSAEIIKPILRGRDIQRWRAEWAGLWLIYSHTEVAEHQYPAIRQHLLPFKEKLANRRGGANPKTGLVPYQWWQLQVDYYNSGAYQEFAKEKLLWMQMAGTARVAYAEPGIFSNQKAFIVTGPNIKYLCGMLNSRMSSWFVSIIGVPTGMGLIQWDKYNVIQIPVPQVEADVQERIEELVNQVLTTIDGGGGGNAKIPALERQIDRLVYDLYGLTNDEIAAVEARLER